MYEVVTLWICEEANKHHCREWRSICRYNCGIIHRDLRPQNLMKDTYENLKLIDFGFAKSYEKNEITKRLPIQGTISYGGLKFLKYYLQFPFNALPPVPYEYEYERTFDLQCSLNIIMFMTNKEIKSQMISFKRFQYLQEIASKSYQLWLNFRKNNGNYSYILTLIDNVTKSD
ncbi:unnamed protein product, partial [Rotaria sp. Silwood2]